MWPNRVQINRPQTPVCTELGTVTNLKIKLIDILSVVSSVVTIFVFLNDFNLGGYVMTAILMFNWCGAALRVHGAARLNLRD